MCHVCFAAGKGDETFKKHVTILGRPSYGAKIVHKKSNNYNLTLFDAS